MNEENILMENVTSEVDEIDNPSTSSKGGALGKIVIASSIAVAGIAAFLYNTRNKREAKNIDKLRKKGYTIVKPVDKENHIEVDSEDSEEVTE